MSKYDPLSARLAGHAGPEWRASFAELEKVLGFSLPKSARTSKAWWKAPHSRAWTESGWEAAEVDQGAGLVTFRRAATPGPAENDAAPPPAVTDEPWILKRLDPSPKWGVALVAGSVALVAGLGALAIRGMLRRK